MKLGRSMMTPAAGERSEVRGHRQQIGKSAALTVRSFPSKIKCCVDRLSWLPKADNRGRGGNVRLCHEQASRHEAIKKAGRPTLARPARFLAANVSYLMVWITLDIGRASSNPLPISLSTASLYSGSGSTGVLPTTCTTL